MACTKEINSECTCGKVVKVEQNTRLDRIEWRTVYISTDVWLMNYCSKDTNKFTTLPNLGIRQDDWKCIGEEW